MLSVFGDESADETKSRVFAVAGVIGREADWQAAEDKWVGRTGGEIFHAADCEYNKDFELYKDLTQILAQSRLAARGIALDLIAFREFFPHISVELGYYKCLMMVVIWLTENVASKLGEPIEFTFDRRSESEHNAGELYKLMATKYGRDCVDLMGREVGFSTRENPRIQMADLVARETMKSLDNKIGPVKRGPRKSMLALSGRVNIGVFDRKYCADWRAAIDADPDLVEDFAAWLERKKLTPNISNRIAYLYWLETRQKKE